MSETPSQPSRELHVLAMNNADELGYLGQQAVAEAVSPGDDYRIVGGHMVRLLLEVYPTPTANPRSTLDADAAVGDVEVIGPLFENLIAQDFVKEGGNVFRKQVGGKKPIEINLLLSRLDHSRGLRQQVVEGVGQVDTLPELSWVMLGEPLVLNVTAVLRDGRSITYRTRIPDIEAAVVLKAHAWKARRMQEDKDLADLSTLFEIRHAYPDLQWRLNEPELRSFRKDSARALHELANTVTRKNVGYKVPAHLDRKHLAALIKRYVALVR
ncbi:hypothetical protein [Brevibacterium aurantiacum]|uniref:Nucleotidyl transferase AbiEii toxin, Type IV TA system n=1 Tax=Brevibacterium aurantiacum TaxID=273384 RepID=A0A4Z0KHV0_BREAU|nr:hypothetical protein [Brevibacterium aurantiacum]TGD38305.1 hypothetical protein EB834_12530 [Brevibacterium aurantiacum]